jgi:hypothetical protein
MAAGKASDFVIYHEQYYSGTHEALGRYTEAFNAASQNCMQLVPKFLAGDYEYSSFLLRPSNLVTRRSSGVGDATIIGMSMEDMISVKLNRKIGPLDQTMDSWKKIGKDFEEMSFHLGQMIAEDKMVDFLDYALYAAEAALSGQSDNTYDATGQSTTTMTATHLNSGLNLMGDMARNVKVWVMHSKVWRNLIAQAISDKIYNEAGTVVYGGDPGTLNRPVIVTDSSALQLGAESTSTTYQTLGLVEGGVVVTESEEETLIYDEVTGKENMQYRVQGEYTYNIMLKGFAWDVSNGGANPTLSTLKTATNWDKVYSNKKNLCGIRIVTT